MTIAEKVAGFLRKNKGKPFCDDCIAERIPLKRRQQAHRVTSALGVTGEFRRIDGECSACRKAPRKVCSTA